MNILRWMFVALLIQTAAPQLPSALIQGRVVKQGTTEPIAGVTVELSRIVDSAAVPNSTLSTTPNAASTATTGDDGKFVFPDLQTGNYRLVAVRPGGAWTPAEYGQRDPNSRGAPVALTAGQQMTDVELRMAATGSISGRIFNRDNEPVGNARVLALQSRYQDGRKVLNTVQAVRTNDFGEYRLFWLPPGRYYIAVQPVDPRDYRFSLYITPPGVAGTREDASAPVISRRMSDEGEVIEETDVLVYYGGGLDLQKARAIDLLAGTNVAAADVPVAEAKVRAHRIRGVVTDGNGLPQVGAKIWVVPRDLSPHHLIPTGVADKNGRFNISGAIPGNYFLVAASNGGMGGSATETFLTVNGLSTRIPLEVGNSDLENMTVVMKPPFTVRGRIAVEGASANDKSFDPARARITLSRDPDILGLPAVSGPGAPSEGQPAADGTFVLGGFGPGEYRVNVTPIPQDLYVKSIRVGTADVLNDGWRLDDPPDGELDIVIAGDAGAIDGIAVNDKSEPAMNCTVVLVPDFPMRGRAYRYMSASTDVSGQFHIQGIAPGDYKAFAWETVETGAWLDPEFLQVFEARGTSIHIGERAKESLQVNLIPQGK